METTTLLNHTACNIWVEVDLEAIASNAWSIRNLLYPNVAICGVVKSDAYGHGIVQVSRALIRAGAFYLGIASVEEACQVREGGIQAPIFRMVPSLPEEYPWNLQFNVDEQVGSLAAAEKLAEFAAKAGKKVRIHVNVDTGIGRQGIWWETAIPDIIEIARTPGLELVGIMTHFAQAPTLSSDYTNDQINRFRRIIIRLDEQGIRPKFQHAANSAGFLGFPNAQFTMARPGVSLYGISPIPGGKKMVPLRTAMSVKTKVAQIKRLPAGSSIGYDRTYITERDATVATLPVGYYDGVHRALSNRGNVLIGGIRRPIVGRVSMNMITVLLGDDDSVRVGDEAVLMGRQGEESIPPEEIAKMTATTVYEVFLGFGRGKRKFYKGEAELAEKEEEYRNAPGRNTFSGSLSRLRHQAKPSDSSMLLEGFGAVFMASK